MRSALLVVILTVAIASTATTSTSAACQCVCRMTPYGKQCRMVCSPPPVPRHFVPDRSYNYAAPSFQGPSGPTVPSELLGIVLLALIGIIALIASALSGSATRQLITEAEQYRASAADMQAQTHSTWQRVGDLEDYMQARARESFERGQRDAEETYRRG